MKYVSQFDKHFATALKPKFETSYHVETVDVLDQAPKLCEPESLKVGKVLPCCVATHRCEPGEFRGHLLQQTTLSQAAEPC